MISPNWYKEQQHVWLSVDLKMNQSLKPIALVYLKYLPVIDEEQARVRSVLRLPQIDCAKQRSSHSPDRKFRRLGKSVSL